MSIEITNPFLLPLGTQRYHQALKYIQSLNPNFIIDFGCNDCGFLYYLSRDPGDLQFSIGIDKDDRILLKGYRSISAPGVYYPHTRPYPVYLLHEDITKLSDDFISKYKNCPFITIIEVIEHLTIEDLDLASEQIFGKLNPMSVYLTTPNIEYNEIITENFGKDRRVGQFRHADHKFEWTRSEFRDWCNKICTKFNYSGNIEGVGKCVDDESKNLGFASHSVLFKNNNQKSNEGEKNFDQPDKFLYKHEFQIKIEGDFDEKVLNYNEYDDNYNDYDSSFNDDENMIQEGTNEEEENNNDNN